MLTVKRTGRGVDIAAEIRAVASSRVPLAAARALTFTAQKGQRAVLDAMPKVFAGGASRYTLNSTRIETATPAKLVARVAVKDRASRNGTLPEDYLFPEVYGGPRNEKRFERAMRYAGALRGYAILGRDTPGELLDAQGNLKRGEMQRILTATRTAFDRYQRKSTSARSRRNARKAPYFVGGLPRVSLAGGEVRQRPGAMQPGVYRRRAGGGIVPVLIFTAKRPSYRQRLDFEGLVRQAALREFEPTFVRLLRQAAG